jgi:hypothetical protein
VVAENGGRFVTVVRRRGHDVASPDGHGVGPSEYDDPPFTMYERSLGVSLESR